MELQRLVDVLERQRVDGVRVVLAGGCCELGRLAIGQQDLRAIGELRLTVDDALLAVGSGSGEEVVPFVGPAHRAHPAGAIPDADA